MHRDAFLEQKVITGKDVGDVAVKVVKCCRIRLERPFFGGPSGSEPLPQREALIEAPESLLFGGDALIRQCQERPYYIFL